MYLEEKLKYHVTIPADSVHSQAPMELTTATVGCPKYGITLNERGLCTFSTTRTLTSLNTRVGRYSLRHRRVVCCVQVPRVS